MLQETRQETDTVAQSRDDYVENERGRFQKGFWEEEVRSGKKPE